MNNGTDHIACRTLNQASSDQLLEMLATAVCRTVRRTDPWTAAPCWYRCLLGYAQKSAAFGQEAFVDCLEQWIIAMCSL